MLYAQSGADFMQEIERSVCGCDYGGTSWTTRAEADQVARRMELAPGKRLLEVGAGAGWPGIYLAKETGCDVALVDLPLEGLKAASARAATDGLEGDHWIAQGDGTALPFRDGSFDAVFHSDVLCCLVEKEAVLRECRRVLRGDGKLVFSVIYITPDISPEDHALALAGGPAFVEALASYPQMLENTGWKIVDRVDLTDDYGESTRRHVAGLEAHRTQFAETFGLQEAEDTITKRRNNVRAIEAGVLKRELFEAVAT
jgi:SAM-dependent methyltransferase